MNGVCMRIISSMTLATVVVSGCSTTSQPATGIIGSDALQVRSGVTFDLKAGQEAQVVGTPITLRFKSVSQDSRCPSGVQCVWAGDAVVNLRVSSTEGTTLDTGVHTNLEPRTAVVSGYQVRVVGLNPAPKSGVAIPAGNYVASLQVATR